MKFASTLVTSAAFTYAGATAFDLTSFFEGLNVQENDSIVNIGLKFLSSVRDNAEGYLAAHPEAVASEHPYFNFMPMIQGSVVPDGTPTTWSAKCFAENTAVAKTQSDGSIQVTVTSAAPVSDSCSDLYWLITVTGQQEVEITVSGDTTISWTVPADVTQSESWDLANKGIRFMEFMTDRTTTIANLMEVCPTFCLVSFLTLCQTVLLFIPEFTKNVDPRSAQRNVEFMATYPRVRNILN
jgi:hypothetical protein